MGPSDHLFQRPFIKLYLWEESITFSESILHSTDSLKNYADISLANTEKALNPFCFGFHKREAKLYYRICSTDKAVQTSEHYPEFQDGIFVFVEKIENELYILLEVINVDISNSEQTTCEHQYNHFLSINNRLVI